MTSYSIKELKAIMGRKTLSAYGKRDGRVLGSKLQVTDRGAQIVFTVEFPCNYDSVTGLPKDTVVEDVVSVL